MSNILDGLNSLQREAAEYMGGPLLILAGAGSGKTRVLTYKIAYMIEKEMIKPWEILAITFTNKAAKEMKSRVEELVGEGIAKDIWLGTFHAICVRILRREIERLGYTRDFNIMDELDKQKVIKEIMKKIDIDDKQYPANSIGYEISASKNNLQDSNKYLASCSGDFRREKIASVFIEYEKTLKKNNSLDFDDLLVKVVELFMNYPEVLNHYQNKFKYLLVDEYQDTNKVQFIFISLIASCHGNICVVGDDSQSIYGFRGADISNILNFEKCFESAKVIKLEQNYRSTKNILNAANHVIKKNKKVIDKNLWTDNDEGSKIKYFTAKHEYEEAQYIADTIDKQIRDEGLNYSDFAVLFRTNAQSRAIEEIFMREGTPYRLISGLKFYSRKEIKDIVAYLKLINNPVDNVSLKRVINEPKRGIGDTTLENLSDMADISGMSIFEYISNSSNLANLRSSGNIMMFKNIINELIEKKETLGVTDLIKQILLTTGYEDMLLKEKTTEAENRLENIYEFVGVAVEFEKENVDNTLFDFLESIALVSDVDNLEEGALAVTLMTMHSSKGLEYNVVYICGMEEGLFPSKKSIFEDEEVEEERRLCYVGITRAKKHLHLTGARQRTLYGSTTYTEPSRFILEVPDNLYDEVAIENKNSSRVQKQDTNIYLDRGYGRVQNKINEIGSKISSSVNIENSKGNRQQNSYADYGNAPQFGVSPSSFLKNIGKNTNVSKTESQLDEYKVGIKVDHKKFGIGVITKVEKEDDDLKLEIEFEKFGMKRLMAAYANLEII